MKTYETSVARLTEHFEARKKVVFIPVLNEEMEKATRRYAMMAEIETGSGLSLIVNQCADMDSTSILLLVINPEREQDIIDFATAIGDKYNVDVKIFSTTKQTINDLIVGKDFQLNNDFSVNRRSVSNAIDYKYFYAFEIKNTMNTTIKNY